jgi:capsular exopolysaccharide synthesis family protein
VADDLTPFGEGRGAARYLAAVREHWFLIALLVVVAVAAAAGYSFTAAKRYKAEADLLVTPVPAGDDTFVGIGLLRESSLPGGSVLTAARLVRTPQVAEGVRSRLHVATDRTSLLGSVDVRPISQSNIVTVGVTAATPDLAARIANAFAREAIAQRTQVFQRSLRSASGRLAARLRTIPPAQRNSAPAQALEQRLAELRSLAGAKDPTLQISSLAVAPSAPSWPRPALSIAVALITAILVGIGAAIGLELASPRVKREDELLLQQRLPILARVPRMSRRVVRRYLTGRQALPGHVWEAYRILRASLASAGPDGGFPRTVLVTSAIPGEGKTMTAVNLSITMAFAGVRVILVDGDLRHPMVATFFGARGRRAGFSMLLSGNDDPEHTLVRAPGHGDRLRMLLSAPEHTQLVDLLDARRIERVLDQLKDQADVVVIDSPPLTEVADALTLADAADAVVVAVRLGRTRRDKLNELRRLLARRHVSPVGFVLTSKRRTRGRAYYQYAHPAPPTLTGAVTDEEKASIEADSQPDELVRP